MTNITPLLCRICGDPVPASAIVVRDARKGPVYQCSGCGSVLLITDQTQLHTVFSGIPQKQNLRLLRSILSAVDAWTDVGHLRQQFYVNWLVHYADLRSVRSVLDIGCGDGTLLRAFWKAGRTISGYEPHRPTVATSRVRHAIHVDYFDGTTALGETFDLLVLGQNLYYWYDSLAILEKADTLLNPEGYLFITTGNTDDPRILDGVQSHAPTILSHQAIVQHLGTLGYQLLVSEAHEPRHTPWIDWCRDRLIRAVPSAQPLAVLMHSLARYAVIWARGSYEHRTGYHRFLLAQKSGGLRAARRIEEVEGTARHEAEARA